MTHVAAEPCFDCNYTDCVMVCYQSEKLLYIYPDECIDCDACVSECLVDAIFPRRHAP